MAPPTVQPATIASIAGTVARPLRPPAPQPSRAPLPTGWRRWVLGARPRTLPAAIAPVVVGTAIAPREDLQWWVLLCALGVALCVQVATNYANDYSDGRRGTDDPGARVGPPRLVGNGLATPEEVKRAMLVAFGLTAVFGAPLVILVDWRLVFVGVAAIAAGWFYTGGSRPYGYAGLGEVFVFVFFGLVATVGSCFVQMQQVPWLAIVAGVAMGCLSTSLLVVNNLRDIPGDASVGKRTLAVRLGDARTRMLYVVLLVVPFLLLPFMAGLGGRPVASLAFVALVLARRPVVAVLSGARGPQLVVVLGDTARVQLVYGLLFAIGCLVGS
ncbi:MAG: 1,4-dihydroxy-2-naphthoate polyprenyltransferase [Actinobacteria bacterium]|nr:1,4-dihydroxy-2-naphthoate polyprenyltransferase [Actinomycetota bacterium]